MIPFVVGLGAVGVHAARQLAATPGIERVLVTDADRKRADALAEEGGSRVEVVDWKVGTGLPSETTVVVPALPAGPHFALVEAAVEAGVPAVSGVDTPKAIRGLLDLDSAAAAAGVPVVIGAGLAPGLSEILARQAADSLDTADEVDVARYGTTGRAARRATRHSSWGRGLELDHGTWANPRAGTSRRLVYFPEPVGPYDCRRAANGAPVLLARAIPGLRRATVRYAMRPLDRVTGRPVARRVPSGRGLGALWVEVRGARGAARELLTLGVVDDMAAAAGAVLASAAAVTLALVPGVDVPSPGVAGVAEVASPRALLSDLARRGVRAARFEGADAR